MKVDIVNNKYIVYLYDEKYNNKDIKQLLKELLNILKKYYGCKINSSSNLRLYINKYYGMILEITNEEEFNQLGLININLKILNDTLFLYEIEDPLDYLNEDIYYYNNKYYLSIKKKSINIMENAKIIYGKEVYKIIGKGIKL